MANNERLDGALRAADVPTAARVRIKRAVATHDSLAEDPLIDVVVSEVASGELGRVHESVWLFSTRFAMEASLLDADEDDLDFVPLPRGIRHIIVKSRSYDWRKPNVKSRLRAEVWFSDTRYGEIKASEANCNWLRDVLARTLLPNVHSPGPEDNQAQRRRKPTSPAARP